MAPKHITIRFSKKDIEEMFEKIKQMIEDGLWSNDLTDVSVWNGFSQLSPPMFSEHIQELDEKYEEVLQEIVKKTDTK